MESQLEHIQTTLESKIKSNIQSKVILNFEWLQKVLADVIDRISEETMFGRDFFEYCIFWSIMYGIHHPIVYFGVSNHNDCGWIYFCMSTCI